MVIMGGEDQIFILQIGIVSFYHTDNIAGRYLAVFSVQGNIHRSPFQRNRMELNIIGRFQHLIQVQARFRKESFACRCSQPAAELRFSCTAVPAPERETLSAPAVYNNVPSISCSGFGMDDDGSERTHLFCFFKLIAPPAVEEAVSAPNQYSLMGRD